MILFKQILAVLTSDYVLYLDLPDHTKNMLRISVWNDDRFKQSSSGPGSGPRGNPPARRARVKFMGNVAQHASTRLELKHAG